MYKTQIFTSNNINILKKNMDGWFDENPEIKIVCQSQSAVGMQPTISPDTNTFKPLITVTVIYTEKEKKTRQING